MIVLYKKKKKKKKEDELGEGAESQIYIHTSWGVETYTKLIGWFQKSTTEREQQIGQISNGFL